jgi:hypothetical protein
MIGVNQGAPAEIRGATLVFVLGARKGGRGGGRDGEREETLLCSCGPSMTLLRTCNPAVLKGFQS